MRYHVNPHTGNAGPCSARISCPYGNLETDHFDSEADARAAYEAGNLDKAFSTLSKTLDEVVASPFVKTQTFHEEGGVQIDTSLVRAADLRLGDRVWDSIEKQTYTVMLDDDGNRIMRGTRGDQYSLEGSEENTMEHRVDKVVRPRASDDEVLDKHMASTIGEASDDELLAAIEKAGWRRFDPASSMGITEDFYHSGGTDFPALTDEAMDEMSTGNVVFSSSQRDTMSGIVHVASVNTNFGTFDIASSDARDIDAVSRVVSEGQWDAFIAIPTNDLRLKAASIRRYLGKKDPLGYIDDARLDASDEMEALAGRTDSASEQKRKEIKLDLETMKVAESVLLSEDLVKSNRTVEPPF